MIRQVGLKQSRDGRVSERPGPTFSCGGRAAFEGLAIRSRQSLAISNDNLIVSDFEGRATQLVCHLISSSKPVASRLGKWSICVQLSWRSVCRRKGEMQASTYSRTCGSPELVLPRRRLEVDVGVPWFD